MGMVPFYGGVSTAYFENYIDLRSTSMAQRRAAKRRAAVQRLH